MEDAGVISQERAEYLWRIMVKAMKYWGRRNEIPDKIVRFYPPTFKKAKKYCL